MKILAFLQNQWFKDPEKWKTYLEGPHRQRYIAFALFAGCQTGKRIEKAFGNDACDMIWWEEASREISGKASFCPPADPAHMLQVIQERKPDVVLCFGRVAHDGMIAILKSSEGKDAQARFKFHLIIGPHPAARHPDVPQKLKGMADDLAAHVRRYGGVIERKYSQRVKSKEAGLVADRGSDHQAGAAAPIAAADGSD